MSLPDEKFRSIYYTRKFLRDLVCRKYKVPDEVREAAYRCIKHYIWINELEELAKKSPKILEMPKGQKYCYACGGYYDKKEDHDWDEFVSCKMQQNETSAKRSAELSVKVDKKSKKKCKNK